MGMVSFLWFFIHWDHRRAWINWLLAGSCGACRILAESGAGCPLVGLGSAVGRGSARAGARDAVLLFGDVASRGSDNQKIDLSPLDLSDLSDLSDPLDLCDPLLRDPE